MAMAAAGWATTVVAPEFPELVNQSDCIVRAVVKSVHSEIVQPGNRKIITLVELDVKEVIAGKPAQPLVLRMLGGKVGGDEMIVEGAPQFQVGDEDILFVQGNGRQVSPLVAMMHGRYRVMKDTATGKEIIGRSNRQPLRSTAEVARAMSEGGTAQAGTPKAAAPAGPALTPDQFTQQIRAAVKPTNRRLLER
ncbi:MAG TPA: hypothetical protein VHD61_02145 [Lacunisphaera sp.]|nr:hypothetical protein [Lacunisphaera sp.]